MTLIVRPLTGPEELHLFNSFPYILNAEIEGDLAAGRRRPEWLWVALRGDRVTARAAWWSRPGDAQPLLMDVFDVAEEQDGVRLMQDASPCRRRHPARLHAIRPAGLA